jgi:hypothetical protein
MKNHAGPNAGRATIVRLPCDLVAKIKGRKIGRKFEAVAEIAVI